MSDNKETVKEYSNEDITVIWKPYTCIHSKKCWKGLLQVFNPQSRPWVNMSGATTKRIKAQVEECPSGALSYIENERKPKMDNNEIEVQCLEDGPLMVKSDVRITHSNGKVETKKKTTAFCRCGASSNKPFCDGSHTDINFKA